MIVARFIARGPVTVNGRDWRSGDTFEAEPEAVEGDVATGLVELLDEPDAKTARKSKTSTNDLE